MNDDVTIWLCVKIEIHFLKKSMWFLRTVFYSQNCDKTLTTIVFDSNKRHFTQK